MNGRDFLPAARRLANGADEADWRSAASRAYYAAFHAARDLLTDLRFRAPRADRAHNYLYARLNNCGAPLVRRAANLLTDLRTLRNVADYDVRQPFAARQASASVTDTEEILRILDALTPAERVQVTDAMKVYEQQIGDVTWKP
jgi:uncharacterized protein (UPF0332 family)